MTMCWPLNSAEDRAHNIVSTPNAMFASENSGQPSLSSVPVARSNRVPGTEISSDSAGSLESANELDVPPERLCRNWRRQLRGSHHANKAVTRLGCGPLLGTGRSLRGD